MNMDINNYIDVYVGKKLGGKIMETVMFSFRVQLAENFGYLN